MLGPMWKLPQNVELLKWYPRFFFFFWLLEFKKKSTEKTEIELGLITVDLMKTKEKQNSGLG